MSTRCTIDLMVPVRAALVVDVPRAPTTVHGSHVSTWKMSAPVPTVPPCPRAQAFPHCSPVGVFVVEGRTKPIRARRRVLPGKLWWHPTMAGSVVVFRPRVLTPLARAGCAGQRISKSRAFRRLQSWSWSWSPLFKHHLHQRLKTLLQIRQVAQLMEHYMQPARMKLHAQEHTNNPVQRPNFRGQGKQKGARRRIITATRRRICDNTPGDGAQRSGTTPA